MNLRGPVTALTAGCLIAVAVLGGCKDEQARKRAETQKILEQASQDLMLATVAAVHPADDGFETMKRKLEGVVRAVAQLPSDEAGQVAAGALLATAAERELAKLGLSTIELGEAEGRRRRAELSSQVDTGIRLDALASGREMVTSVEQRALIERNRNDAEEALGRYSARLAELDGPIAEREALNENDSEQASSLNRRASELRTEARELGHADGLPTYMQAIGLEREADRHEYEAAQRTSDLELELIPEHGLANSRVIGLRAVLIDLDSNETALDERDRMKATQVGTTRQLLGEYRARIEGSLDELAAINTDILEAAYADALEHADAALRAATRAAGKSGRDAADAARIAVARSHELKGRIHLFRARAQADQRDILRRLVESGSALGDARRFQAELDAAQAASDEAFQAAETELTSATEELERVNSRTSADQVAAFKQSLQISLATMKGEGAAPSLPLSGPAERGGGSAAAPSGGTGGGFATPEELVAAMEAMDGADVASAGRILDTITTPDEATKVFVEIMREGVAAQQDLVNALNERFGDNTAQDVFAQPGMEMMASQDYSNVRLESQTDARATVSYTPSPGMPDQTLELVKVRGSWMIDGLTMPEMAGMDPQMLPMMKTLAGMMTASIRALSARVAGGEFSSAEEAATALNQEFMEIMGGMGGMGGGPGGPPGG